MAPELALLAVLLAGGLAGAQEAQEANAVQWTPVTTTVGPQQRRTPLYSDFQQPPMPPEDRLPRRPGLEGPIATEEPLPPFPDITLVAGTDEYLSRAVPPSIQQLAETVQNDAQFQERVRQEMHDHGATEGAIEFPPEPILSRDRYLGRNWPNLKMEVAPYYLAHGRLLFQQINTERYGWDLGFIQPIVSAAHFYWDFVTLPYNLGKALCRPYEANLGWCLPGDPVPLMLYPPEISFSGLITETATILGLVAIFP